jgi:hypothetical protein
MTMDRSEDDIRQVFREEEAAPVVDAEREESIGDMIAHSFRGQTRWLTWFAGMKIAGTLAVATLSAVIFFAAESTKAQIACAAVFAASLTGCMLWWMWYWLLIQRNAQTREIKRLELQVAKLTSACMSSA